MKSVFPTVALLIVFLLSCEETNTRSIQKLTVNFYEVYAEREDFERLMRFYDESAVLEDPIGGYRMVGKDSIRLFLDWPNPKFNKLEEQALVVEQLLVDERKAVVKGHFTPFTWGEIAVEAMQFTTLLEFNDAGKIVKHTDWINYPNYLINYETRQNSNAWIPK